MANSAPPSTTSADGEHGLARRVAAFAGLALVFGAAMLLQSYSAEALPVVATLNAAIREGLAAREAGPLAAAAGAFAVKAALIGVPTIAMFGIFLVMEVLLAGPPKSWRVAMFAMALQIALTLTYFVIWPILNIVIPTTLGIGPLVLIEQRHLADIFGVLTAPLLALLSLLILSFFGYWAHRAQHAVPLFWRFHAVHHSIEDLDSINCYVHPGDWLVERLFMTVAFTAIGFNFETIVWLAGFNAIRDRLIHSRAPINLGFLAPVLVDNRHHFIHHTIRHEDSGRNFGTFLQVWDRVFGTYTHPERGAPLPRTGLGHKLPPRTWRGFALADLEDRRG